jgi:hypothetical protein
MWHQKCSNTSSAIVYFDEILSYERDDTPFRNNEIEHVLFYHPAYEKYALFYLTHMTIKHIRQKIHLFVSTVYKRNMRISLSLCIRNYYRPLDKSRIHSMEIQSAFYNALSCNNIGFGRLIFSQCGKCRKLTNLCIFTSLDALFIQFVIDNRLIIMSIESRATLHGFVIVDTVLMKKWLAFCTNKVKIVCLSCK